MVDVATLGLSVNSAQVDAAISVLQKFSAASKAAEQSTAGVKAGTDQAAASAQKYAQSLTVAATSAAAINQRMGVQNDFGGASRAADIAAYGTELDKLRAKYSPLFEQQQKYASSLAEISRAARVGALTEEEHAKAVQKVEVSNRVAVHAINENEKAILNAGKTATLGSAAMANLSFQINDVATMAALGMDPLRILATQGGQFYQILAQGEGGVRGSMSYLWTVFTGLLTPLRLVVAGVGGLAAAALIAGMSFASARREMDLALIGTGSAAGMTAAKIEGIAFQAERAGQMTVGQAREMALAFAATGKISAEVAAQAISMGRNVALVFGESLTEAGDRLAKALADPAKGVDELDKRLSAFDATTAQNIKNLDGQNRRFEAQALLIRGVRDATEAASQMTSGWTAAWNSVSEAASRYWALTGRSVARTFGLESLQEKADSLREELGSLTSSWGGWLRMLNQSEIDKKTAELQRLEATIAQLGATASANRGSRQLDGLIAGIVPDSSTRQELENTLATLRSLAAQEGVFERLPTNRAAELQRSIEVTQARIAGLRTAGQLQKEEHDLEMQRIAARTPAQQAEIAYQETLIRLRSNTRLTGAEVQSGADNARTQVLAQAARDLTRAQETRVLSAQQSVEAARSELGLVGATTAQQELATAQMRNRHQLESEALRIYGDRNAFDARHLAALNEESARVAETNRLLRERQLMQDLAFERSQLGRTTSEADVYARLRSAGMLTNGEIVGSSAEAAAAQIRLNTLLRTNVEASREFAGSFAKDMLAGKTATEALSNALNRLADKLMDLALDSAFSALLGGGKAGGNSPLIGLFGGGLTGNPAASAANPGAMGASVMHTGGLVGANDNLPVRLVDPSVFAGARRYHQGGVIGSNEVPAILEKGERVLPKGARLGGDVIVQITNVIDAKGAYPESIEQIKSALAKQNAQLPANVIRLVREAKDRNVA